MRNFLLIPMVILLVECRKDDDSDIELILQDTKAREDLVVDLVGEGMDSGDSGETDAASLSLSGKDSLKDITKTCTVTDGDAVVEASAILDYNYNLDRSLFSGTWQASGPLKQTRSWSHTGAALSCSGNSVGIDWQNVSGLNLKLDFNHDLTFTTTLTSKNNGNQFERVRKTIITGQRSVIWQSTTEADGVYTIVKEITSNVTHNSQLSRANGDQQQTTWAVVAGSPALVLETKRDSSFAVTSKNIKSGLITATLAGGSVSVSFSHWLYNRTEQGCLLQSGSATLTFKNSDDETIETLTCKVDQADISCEGSSQEAFQVTAPVCNQIHEA